MPKKPLFGPDSARWAQIRSAKCLFSKIWYRFQRSRYHGQLSACTISEKTEDPILRQVEESDFIGRCPTNAERPK